MSGKAAGFLSKTRAPGNGRKVHGAGKCGWREEADTA